jgi:hypothetical protein
VWALTPSVTVWALPPCACVFVCGGMIAALRRRILDDKFMDDELLKIRPGGVNMIKRHVVGTMRADVISSQRRVFRERNPPLVACPACKRGFGLRCCRARCVDHGFCGRLNPITPLVPPV